ncbi:hypothetical protein SBRCBS47491_000767 [Sporothrix bragantina]|uniref:CFEM domain-containing protein n=1 Tax=Sporothrix bragantina TaxID=671064 RepID=A0ABP0AT18_9PEZI
MKSRTSTTEIGRRRRLAVAATTLFFVGAVVAESTTGATSDAPTATTGTGTATSTLQTGTISVTGTTLPQLVTETEPCAVLCYNAACLDSGCSPGDFSCVCGNPHSLVVKMGLCVGKDCDNSRQFDSGDWIADVCSAYDRVPSNSAELASASSLIVAEISSAAATATNNPVPSTGTISNGSGTKSAGAASTGTETSAAAASARLGGAGGGGILGGVFGLTSLVVGLVGGATMLVAGVL